MSCCGISTPSSVAQSEDRPCLQKPLTKAALIVIGLLFAGGAVASHFAGLGIAGIVAFSGASGGSLLLVVLSSLCSSLKSQPETKVPEEKKQIDLMTERELVNDLIAVKDGPFADDSTEKNKLILLRLKELVIGNFNAHAKEGVAAVAQALQPLFAEAHSSPDKFETLVSITINESGYFPRFTDAVLENLEWPSEEMKNTILPHYLASKILIEHISWQDQFIDFGTASFHAHRLVVITKNIFGYDNFFSPLSDSLAKGLGEAIRYSGNVAIEELKKEKTQGTLDQNRQIGIYVAIGQFDECLFSASTIAPLLPHLAHIPGLVGLELTDLKGPGFEDKDAESLLNILRTNPHLTQLEVKIGGMSPAKQSEFMQEWQKIRESRELQPPSLEALLA